MSCYSPLNLYTLIHTIKISDQGDVEDHLDKLQGNEN